MTDQRLNYFNRQFLKANDFLDEQGYHVDRARRHNRLFHTPGIAEGLDVGRGDEIGSITVAAGTAMDSLGRLIVVMKELKTNLKSLSNRTILLVIKYHEEPLNDRDYQVDLDGKIFSTRWHEAPKLSAINADESPDAEMVILARITIGGDGSISDIDTSVRVTAGGRDSGAKFIDTVDGNFTVNGDLQVKGTIKGRGLGSTRLITPSAESLATLAQDAQIAENGKWIAIPGLSASFDAVNESVLTCQYVVYVQPGPRKEPEYEVYTVTELDRAAGLSGIAARYGMPYPQGVEDIMALNNLKSSLIRPGDKLKIPGRTVAPGTVSGTPTRLYIQQKGQVNSALRAGSNINSGIRSRVDPEEIVEVQDIDDQTLSKVGQPGQWLKVRKADNTVGFVEQDPFIVYSGELPEAFGGGTVGALSEGSSATFAPVSLTALGEDFIAARVVIDGQALPMSGSQFYPLSNPIPPNTALTGMATALIGAGEHTIVVQWYKAGEALLQWTCNTASSGEGDAQGFVAGRGLTVTVATR
ncbi:MAG: LysM peptidoglycan-binding domain-containing protein [Anaerolineae bacterium]|jgi:LysM repeat protein|nr:LysM peptidoglycan-binding domain-containing protein [Anaerolineae bacterium]